MQGFTKSSRFKTAITNTVIAMVIYPAIKSALGAAGGNAPMSISSILDNAWPGSLVFGLFFGVLTISYAAFLYNREQGDDGQ